MAEWQQTYDPRDLNYLSRNAKRIRDTASLLGVPALGHAAGRKPQFDDAGRSRARQRRDRQHERRPQSLVPVKSAARAAGNIPPRRALVLESNRSDRLAVGRD
jgi:hypothetical protein